MYPKCLYDKDGNWKTFYSAEEEAAQTRYKPNGFIWDTESVAAPVVIQSESVKIEDVPTTDIPSTEEQSEKKQEEVKDEEEKKVQVDFEDKPPLMEFKKRRGRPPKAK